MNNARIVAIWLGRALANALAGGLAFAIVGAFCGALTGFVTEVAAKDLEYAFAVAAYGAMVGAICGVVGVFIHFIVAATARPEKPWRGFVRLTARIAIGQLLGTLGIITAFLAFNLISSQINNESFSRAVNENWVFIMYSAPALMIIGAIAGAVFKRD